MFNSLSKFFLLIFFVTILFTSHTVYAKLNAESWKSASPKDFPSVEQFYLKHGCRLLFPVVHFYSFSKEHWLPNDEIKKLYPEAAALLPNTECQSNISSEDVSTAFNIEHAQSSDSDIVLIFIGPLEGFLDRMYPQGSQNRIELEEKIARLEAYSELTKYWVTTPLTGMRPQ